MNCSCRRGEAHRLKNYEVYQQGYRDGRESLKELLKEVSFSGAEHDDKRLDYLTVQIDRSLWEAIKKELEQ